MSLKYIDRTRIYIDEIVSIASALHCVEAKHVEYCFRESTVLKPNYELDYIIRNFKVEIGEDSTFLLLFASLLSNYEAEMFEVSFLSSKNLNEDHTSYISKRT